MDRDQAHLAGSELPPPLLVIPPTGDDWYLRPRAVSLRHDLPAEFGPMRPEGERVVVPLLEYEWVEGFIELAQPAGAILDEFIRLDDGPEDEFPERVLSYAKRWGALGICRHGLLSSHRSPPCAALGSQSKVYAADRPRWEPLEAWRRHVHHVGALLRIVRELRIGIAANDGDWRDVDHVRPPATYPLYVPHADMINDTPWFGPDDSLFRVMRPGYSEAAPAQADVATQRGVIADLLQRWMGLGQVRVETRWYGPEDESSPRITLQYGGLRGLLAVQLAATAQSPRGLYQCAGCHHVFTPPEGNRRPAAGRRAWCPDCGRLAQWREYQRSRYERQKAEREASDGEAR